MAIKIVLGGAFVLQLAAAVIALLLNRRYRQRSAWSLISAAAIVMAVRPFVSLVILLVEPSVQPAQNLIWTESLATLLISVLFLAGIAMIEPLFKDLAQAEEVLRREKHDLEVSVAATEQEMSVARAIQKSLLPEGSPELAGMEIAGSSEPAEWTSGDYFDYFKVSEDSLLAVVADVSGHGTGPALLMTETRAYVRALAQTHTDVGEVLTLTNRALAHDIAYGQFVTMFAAWINAETRQLCYASAGHDAYLLRADGTRQVLESSSPPLGVVEDLKIPTSPPIDLKAGDLLLLVTDGLNETRNPAKTQWGVESVLNNAALHRDQPASTIVENLFLEAREFREDTAQEDDNTAVVIKIG
ncbi:MAG: PP2C family protein-serine/threonine phosphatase [Pirellulales bacterium]|nr:PP2C family protein-serine/threonine phosphatase [Pirellulales bacterium]